MNSLKTGLSILLLVLCSVLNAQNDQNEAQIKQEVLSFVDDYWEAYNTCNVDKLLQLETKDTQFYHDLGGFSQGEEISRKNWEFFCEEGPRVFAELVEMPQVFLMKERGRVYGAIISGTLKFYDVIEGERGETAVEKSRYTSFVKFEDGKWLMDVVFSYAHEAMDSQ